MENRELTNEIYLKNEIDANKGLAKGCFFSAVAMLIVWICYLTKLFNVSDHIFLLINIFFPILITVLASCVFYIKTKLIEKPKFKYFLIIQYAIVVMVLNVILPKHSVLMWAVLIILVNHYFDHKALLFTFIMVTIMLVSAMYLGMFYGEWDPALLNGTELISINGKQVNVENTTAAERYEWIKYLQSQGDNRLLKVFIYYYLPREIILILIVNISFAISKRSKKLLIIESEQVKENEKIKSELDVASRIQNSVLPKESCEYVYGIMDAAKEVGGDFFDYFYIDDSHLALVIGDVSGKGIPASLYMMKTETLIQSLTKTFKNDTALIMERCNVALCTNNDANMFVTCWLGIINLSSGELKYTNAGHNKAILILNGKAEYTTEKSGIILGAFDSAKYEEKTVKLNKGDKILLYTDGVTESHNSNDELFGDDRLLEYVNNNIKAPKDFVLGLRQNLNEFAGCAEQFDDITIMMYDHDFDAIMSESRVFKADVKELDNLFEYSSKLLNQLDFSSRDVIMINTALEEIFVNVAHYAYDNEGTVEITLSRANNKVSFVFKDNGKPFNPLERKDPNITASSDEREIGGLGIYMVKKIMDEVHYEYTNSQNVLTLIKYKK